MLQAQIQTELTILLNLRLFILPIIPETPVNAFPFSPSNVKIIRIGLVTVDVNSLFIGNTVIL